LGEREFLGLTGRGHVGLLRGVLGLLSAVLVLAPMMVGVPQAAAVTVTVPCVGAMGKVGSCKGTQIASDANIPSSGVLAAGTYVVTGSFTHNGTLTVDGAVVLVLGDGINWIVIADPSTGEPGIKVVAGSKLTVTSESLGPLGSGMGRLSVGGDDGGAGIGGGVDDVFGVITINGGAITANGGVGAAGIGAGRCSSAAGACGSVQGSVTINNGVVRAYGSTTGAGVGGGGLSAAGQVTIAGGTVTATGQAGGAGIGGCECTGGSTCLGSADKITITGGKVTARSNGGAAIGGGLSGGVPAIVISGGTVDAAHTSGFGAGIGGGEFNVTGPGIKISGGQVTAQGGSQAPGIGPGMGGSPTVTVMTGGTLTAVAGDNSTAAVVGSFTPPNVYEYWTNTGSNADPGGPGTAVPPASAFVNSDAYQFVKIVTQYALSLKSTSGGSVTVGSGGVYAAGDKVKLVATPDKGFKFVGWKTSHGGSFSSPSKAKTTFTMPGNATTVTAMFKAVGGGGSVETGGRLMSQVPLWAGAVLLLVGVGLLVRRRWARG